MVVRPMLTLLQRLRLASLAEAVSYLVLLGVAMPLKYLADMPMAVTVVGMVHGILFLVLIWLLSRARFEAGWPTRRLWAIGLASLVPIVPFYLDRRVRQWIAGSGRGDVDAAPGA